MEIIENTTPAISQDEQIACEINITFDEKVYEKNLTNITVNLPESAQGNLKVKINNHTIYDENVTDSCVVIPIQLPPEKFPVVVANVWPPFDSTIYDVTAFYNDVPINISHDLMVMKYPKDHAPIFMIPSEVLQFGQHYSFMAAILFPRSATGTVEVYLDGKVFMNRTNVTAPFVYLNESQISSLSLAQHRLAAIYSGDDYFEAKTITLDFNVTNIVINIPANVYLDHDDCISVSVSNKSKGTVSVYIDSRLVKKQALDKYGEFLFSMFDDITCGNHEIKVVVECDKFNRTKTVNANTTYDIDLYNLNYFKYGEENIIYVYIPEDLKENLFNVSVNGAKVPFKKVGQDLEINITELDVGNYTVVVTYLGDEKYYRTTVSNNFSVEYAITFYDSFIFYGYGAEVTLNLPADAKGNLSVYLNGILYKTVKMSHGKASFVIDNINPGEYDINITYTGSDYAVENISSTLRVNPDLKYESFIEVGSKNILEFRVPKGCKGTIKTTVCGKNYTANIKNGLATLDLSNLPIGDWDFDIYYYGADGYNCTCFVGVYVEKAPIKIITSKNTNLAYASGTYKVKVYGTNAKVAKNAKVIFKINGKTVKTTKTNGKGIAALKIPAKYAAGKYTLTVQCSNAKVSKKVNVKHAIILSNVKVKKSAKKVVLTAKLNSVLKGKIVTFKFNGKSIKAKINTKGIAKATVTKAMLNKLKVGKKVTCSATYLKDTVKKSVKVQR